MEDLRKQINNNSQFSIFNSQLNKNTPSTASGPPSSRRKAFCFCHPICRRGGCPSSARYIVLICGPMKASSPTNDLCYPILIEENRRFSTITLSQDNISFTEGEFHPSKTDFTHPKDGFHCITAVLLCLYSQGDTPTYFLNTLEK